MRKGILLKLLLFSLIILCSHSGCHKSSVTPPEDPSTGNNDSRDSQNGGNNQGSQDSQSEEGNKFEVVPVDVVINPGDGRVEISLTYDSNPDASSVKIAWERGEMELNIDINSEEPQVTITTIIDNLNEGENAFTITTFDDFGNPSEEVEASGNVYGSTFGNSLKNREVEEVAYDENGNSQIIWGDLEEGMIGEEIHYNSNQILRVDTEEKITTITESLDGYKLEYRTLYIPEENSIDTFYTEYETVEFPSPIIELDKANFGEIHLPNDVEEWAASSQHPLSILWDGNPNQFSWYRSQENTGSGEYMKFTFDLGTVTKLTSYKLWQRGARGGEDEQFLFSNVNPKEWEIWGREDDPSGTDGSWDGWTKIATNESYKPSGLPHGQLDPVDIEYAKDGEPFYFESAETIPVRYLRFRIKDVWSPGTPHNSHFFLMELSFFGIIQ